MMWLFDCSLVSVGGLCSLSGLTAVVCDVWCDNRVTVGQWCQLDIPTCGSLHCPVNGFMFLIPGSSS